MDSGVADHSDVRAALTVLEAWVDARVMDQEVPSLAIAVVHDQTLVWSRAFGHADPASKTAATTGTRYRIGSITKLFTATAILQLRDAGALRLDDTVASHLPWFSIARQPTDGSAEVTIRHLLTHTSGLPRESLFPYWTDFKFPSPAELRDALMRQAAILPLDTQWKYSNLAYALAGEIVAAASGTAYAEYVRTRILHPLGMADTLVEAPADADPTLARGYGRRLPGRPRRLRPVCDMRALGSAGNMSSTVQDLAKFGFRVFRDGAQTCVGHGGLVAGHAAHLRLIPDAKVAIMVLTSAEDTAPHAYTHRAMQLLLPALAVATRRPAPAPAIDPAWARYVGRYRGDWGDVQVVLTGQGLEVIAPLAEDPTQGRITLTAVAEHTFRMAGNDGYDAPGELVTFEVAPDGRVTAARFAMEPIYPRERLVSRS